MPAQMPKGKPAKKPTKDPMDAFWGGLSKPATGAQQAKEMQGAMAYKGKPKPKPAGPPPRNPKQGKGMGRDPFGEAARIMGPGDKPKGKKKK